MGKSNNNNKNKKTEKRNLRRSSITKKVVNSSINPSINPSINSPLDFFAEIAESKSFHDMSWKTYLETKKELGENVIVGIPYLED